MVVSLVFGPFDLLFGAAAVSYVVGFEFVLMIDRWLPLRLVEATASPSSSCCGPRWRRSRSVA